MTKKQLLAKIEALTRTVFTHANDIDQVASNQAATDQRIAKFEAALATFEERSKLLLHVAQLNRVLDYGAVNGDGQSGRLDRYEERIAALEEVAKQVAIDDHTSVPPPWLQEDRPRRIPDAKLEDGGWLRAMHGGPKIDPDCRQGGESPRVIKCVVCRGTGLVNTLADQDCICGRCGGTGTVLA